MVFQPFTQPLKFALIALALTGLLLSGCGLPARSTPTPVNLIQTAAAGTVVAQLNEAAATGVVVIIATVTPTPDLSAVTATTQPPEATSQATSTPLPAAQPIHPARPQHADHDPLRPGNLRQRCDLSR